MSYAYGDIVACGVLSLREGIILEAGQRLKMEWGSNDRLILIEQNDGVDWQDVGWG